MKTTPDAMNPDPSRTSQRLKYLLIPVILSAGALFTCAEDLSWQYLGQIPPGNTPVVFAPGVVSVANKNTHALAISPDGKTIIFSRYPDGTSFIMTYTNNQWSGPVQSFFYGKEVSFSPDGNKMFYYTGDDIYYVARQGSGWNSPVRLGPNVNTTGNIEYYPSIVRSQSMYFSRAPTNGDWSTGRIMFSEYTNGDYQPAVDLGAPINNGGALHAWVAPDESYMLFNSPRPGSHTGLDIWASFRNQDGTWSNPRNVGATVNSGADAILCPKVSPDGKYLFFTKLTQPTGLVYWVANPFFPQVTISLNNTNVNLSWSTNLPNFTLESVARLGDTWTTVPGVTGYSATLPVSADSQFFRLRR
ncbi:MAG: hypothetical protein ABSH15_01620 [Verrucomicrobiota bacterium]|jgi:Tol biopolymer transport system component